MVGPASLCSILRNALRDVACSVFIVWCLVFAVSGGIMVCAPLVCEGHPWCLLQFFLAVRVTLLKTRISRSMPRGFGVARLAEVFSGWAFRGPGLLAVGGESRGFPVSH